MNVGSEDVDNCLMSFDRQSVLAVGIEICHNIGKNEELGLLLPLFGLGCSSDESRHSHSGDEDATTTQWPLRQILYWCF